MEPIIAPEETTFTPNPICPHIGLKNDALTCYQTPSSFNYCQQVREPASVNLRHQQRCCLTSEYLQCPVLQRSLSELPPALKLREKENPARPKVFPWLLFGLLLSTAGVVLIGRTLPSRINTVAVKDSTPSPTIQHTIPAQTTPINDTSDNKIELTPQQIIAATPTPLSIYSGVGMATPLGPGQNYLIHRVTADESLSSIADQYHTSREAIQTVNIDETDWVIWQNDILVIPLDDSDPTLLQPLTGVYVDAYHFIADFALELNCSEADIRKLNTIPPEDTILQSGQWVVIPKINDLDFHRVFTPTPAFDENANTLVYGSEDEYLLHQVTQEKSLADISDMYNSSPEALAKLNGIPIEASLELGQMLVVRPNYRLPLLANRVYVFHIITPIQSDVFTAQMGWDHAAFLFVNHLKSQNPVLRDRWVIYPEKQ